MKTLYCTYLAFWLLLIGCENPSRVPFVEKETPAEKEQRELIEGKRTFQTRYHPEDTMFGHPRGFCYLPGEQAIPYDTLKNTHSFAAALYCDTVGWGVYNRKIERETFNGTFTNRVGDGYAFYYGINGEYISGGRSSRGEMGVLEIYPPQARATPNHEVSTVRNDGSRGGCVCYFFQLSMNSDFVRGWEVQYKGETVNVPGTLLTRADYFEVNPGRTNPLGTWEVYTIKNLFSEDMYPFIPKELQPEDINQTAAYYRPRRIYMRPADKAIDERYHKRGEPLRLTWQGDPDRPHDSIIISISTFNNTFPKEFGFDYGTITPIMGRGTYRNGRQVDLSNIDVNSPRGPNQARGPRPFDLVPSLAGREDNLKRIFMQYREATPLPHIEWNMTVFENDGTNTVEIPASVFDQFPSDRLIEVRAYRWYDQKLYFPNQLWLAGDNKTFRSHLRIVTFSYGGLYLQE